VWFTSSLFWLYFTPFYRRLFPIFSVENNAGKGLETETDFNFDAGNSGQPKSSFRIVQDVKDWLYGHYDDENSINNEAKFFGDPYTLNITYIYFDSFSPGKKLQHLSLFHFTLYGDFKLTEST